MEQQNLFFEFVCGGSQVTGAFSDFLRLGILSSTEKGNKQVYQSNLAILESSSALMVIIHWLWSRISKRFIQINDLGPTICDSQGNSECWHDKSENKMCVRQTLKDVFPL